MYTTRTISVQKIWAREFSPIKVQFPLPPSHGLKRKIVRENYTSWVLLSLSLSAGVVIEEGGGGLTWVKCTQEQDLVRHHMPAPWNIRALMAGTKPGHHKVKKSDEFSTDWHEGGQNIAVPL